MELIAFTDDFARRCNRRALLVMHLNLQFSAIALRGSGNDEKTHKVQGCNELCEPRHHRLTFR
jgi:hypothetical protein